MRTVISRDYRFEAAHRLPQVPPDHKCARLHGHSFRITIQIQGNVDPQKGWIVDFSEIDKAWQPLHQQLDHRLLNDIEGLENPTSEILAQWIFHRFEIPGVKLIAVTVAETCTATCTVYAD